MEKTENLKKFGTDFQQKCLSALVSDKSFIERISDIIDHNFFETDSLQWVCRECMLYFLEYKTTPTLTVFKVKIDSITNEILRTAYVDCLRNVFQKVESNDLDFVKEQFLDFCKNQILKKAILDSVEHLNSGEYEKIKQVVDHALKAGMERNMGHVYDEDVEARMSMTVRNCVPTGWDLIDSLLDGGLGAGELGIFAGNPGGGKCVGPDTEIEIEYYDTGIEFTGNSGKKHILWISPFEKFELDGHVLYGWQVDNIIYELKKLETPVQT
jgi:hypothetical protein